ncbi:MAG: hypothetical protein IPM82_31140 [Saprospiraceae bacterium]|nr:hypothetical protein [Saprospiraceae bacterium]
MPKTHLSAAKIDQLTYPDVTDDRIFGYITRLTIEQFDQKSCQRCKNRLQASEGVVVVYGTGAAVVAGTGICWFTPTWPLGNPTARMRRTKSPTLCTITTTLNSHSNTNGPSSWTGGWL